MTRQSLGYYSFTLEDDGKVVIAPRATWQIRLVMILLGFFVWFAISSRFVVLGFNSIFLLALVIILIVALFIPISGRVVKIEPVSGEIMVRTWDGKQETHPISSVSGLSARILGDNLDLGLRLNSGKVLPLTTGSVSVSGISEARLKAIQPIIDMLASVIPNIAGLDQS